MYVSCIIVKKKVCSYIITIIYGQLFLLLFKIEKHVTNTQFGFYHRPILLLH